mmetsp:Transcript_19657/g.59445  ORF Transcript_19657/g.59445 Transcript_19657/m.59445 type:complete len:151 (+) Transcript_19657:1851-2303(+)
MCRIISNQSQLFCSTAQAPTPKSALMPEAAARLPFCVGAAVGTTVAAEVVASTGAGTVPGADAGATSGAASISGAYGLAAVSSGVGADTMGSGLMGPAGSTIVPLSAVVGLPVDEVELTPCTFQGQAQIWILQHQQAPRCSFQSRCRWRG